MSIVGKRAFICANDFFYSVSSGQPFAAALRSSCWETSLEERETRFDGVSIAYLTINPSVESKEREDKHAFIFRGV